MNAKQKIDPVKLYQTKEYYDDIRKNLVDFPVLLLLEGSAYCNMTCIMCLRRLHVPERDKTGLGVGHMSLDLIKKIVEECKGRKQFLGIHFAEFGEPLMNPKISEMVSFISKAGIKSQIVTNGLLLNDEMIKSLIDSGLTKIKVSFQGATPEKYKFWRNNDFYDNIVKNVHNMVKIRNNMGSDLFIQVGTSSCDDTEEELKQFMDYWNQIVDHVYWNYTGLLHMKGDPLIKDVKILRQAPLKVNPCKELFLRMSVTWNGKVTQCPRDEQHFTGDLNTQTIHEVWHSKKVNENRTIILEKGNCLPLCDHCVEQPKETLNYNYKYKTNATI